MFVRSLPLCLGTIVSFSVLSSCSSVPEVAPLDVTSADGPVQLVLLHTNDIHGKYTTTNATWVDGNPPIGGFANLSAVVNGTRAINENVLLLDAGDVMTGNPICDYYHTAATGGAKGGAMIEFMNLLEYDAMCLGNHEFDHGLESLDQLMAMAEFPILSANTYRPGGGITAPMRHTIIHRGGLAIGVIGVMTESLYGVAAPSKLAGTKVTDMIEETQTIVNDIDPITDLIIVLTHVGVDGDRELARELSGVDVIIGGHSHTRLNTPEVVNGVIIAQAGAHNRYVGEIRMTVDDDRVTRHAGSLIALWPTEGGDERVEEIIAFYDEQISDEYGRVIGRLATEWTREYQAESNIGNWLTEALRADQGGDFALLNSGGIRKNVAAGPITKLDVMEILPFSNVVTTFEVTGAELRQLMATNARATAFRTHGILQMSGLRYTYRVEGEDVVIVDAFVGDEPVDDGKTYTGVSVDYVSHGNADRYLGFEPARREVMGEVVSSVIMRAIEGTAEAIDAKVDGRMQDVTAATGTAG